MLSEVNITKNPLQVSEKNKTSEWIDKITNEAKGKESLFSINVVLDGKPVKSEDAPDIISELDKYTVDKSVLRDKNMRLYVNDVLYIQTKRGDVTKKIYSRLLILQSIDPDSNQEFGKTPALIISRDFKTGEVEILSQKGGPFDLDKLKDHKVELFNKGSEEVLKAAAK